MPTQPIDVEALRGDVGLQSFVRHNSFASLRRMSAGIGAVLPVERTRVAASSVRFAGPDHILLRLIAQILWTDNTKPIPKLRLCRIAHIRKFTDREN
jgi:hypothetical protein